MNICGLSLIDLTNEIKFFISIVLVFISNSDKMKSFGWEPKVGLEEGLEKYIDWRKSL